MLAASLRVSLHAAVPPLTGSRYLTSVTADPAVLVPVVLLAVGYLVATTRIARRPGPDGRPVGWPVGRRAAFLLGLALLLAVTVTFVGVYADTLFWVRALQNLVLLLVAPMLLALGAPLTALAGVLPPAARRRCSAVLHIAPARALSFPPVITILLVAPLFVLYLTPLYEATLRHAAVSGLAGTLLVLAGFGYFWTRLRIDPVPREAPYLVTLWITAVDVLADGILGLILWLGPLLAPSYYLALGRTWAPDPGLDQIIGAGVLWIGGDVAGLPFLALLMVRAFAEDRRNAATVDAELDVLEAAEAAVAGLPDPNDDTEPDAARRTPSRLWWEDDPTLARRFTRGD